MRENIKTEADYIDWHIKTGGYAKDMTLRDHFAGLAMQGLIADGAVPELSGELVAEMSFSMADVMLEERSK